MCEGNAVSPACLVDFCHKFSSHPLASSLSLLSHCSLPPSPSLSLYISKHPLPPWPQFKQTEITSSQVVLLPPPFPSLRDHPQEKGPKDEAQMRMSHGLPLSVFFLPLCLLVFFSLVVFLLVGRQKRRSDRETRLPLPPGSMGLPWIGETLQFYSEDPKVFFASKQKRFHFFCHPTSSSLPNLVLRPPAW